MLASRLCVMLTGTDDTGMSVTANLVLGQLCRPAAKFGPERESYKSVADTVPLSQIQTQGASERSHLPYLWNVDRPQMPHIIACKRSKHTHEWRKLVFIFIHFISKLYLQYWIVRCISVLSPSTSHQVLLQESIFLFDKLVMHEIVAI